MTDIFDEKQDLKNHKSFVAALRKQYWKVMHDNQHGIKNAYNIDEMRLRNHLTMNWPGDELVMQIVKDAVRLMIENNIDPKELL